MKVLNVTFSYAPDPIGGTEVYVADVCRELEAGGVKTVIAAPGDDAASYLLDGLHVQRFPFQSKPDSLDAMYGRGDVLAADAFEAVLDAEQPDIVHQHALTPACSGELVARAQARNLPVVFTYHTPTVSCQRGTMVRWGSEVCDGRLDVRQCTACTLHGLGLSRTVSRMVASAPEAVGDAIASAGLSGGGWTALRMSGLMKHRHDEIRRVLTSVDRVVVLAAWVGDLLRGNGLPEHRLVRAPHGVARVARAPRTAWDAKYVRVAHLGRLDANKGTRLLIEALLTIPDARVTLDIFGITQTDADRQELENIRALTAGDGRIRFLPPLDHAAITTHLAGFDAVAVPSQLLETGPLVVLEAFAAGVPVIGSALGGIAEHIKHGIDGWLVEPYHSVDAWRSVLRQCADEPQFLQALREGIAPPRSIAEAAADMHDLYAAVIAERAVRTAAAPVEVGRGAP